MVYHETVMNMLCIISPTWNKTLRDCDSSGNTGCYCCAVHLFRPYFMTPMVVWLPGRERPSYVHTTVLCWLPRKDLWRYSQYNSEISFWIWTFGTCMDNREADVGFIMVRSFCFWNDSDTYSATWRGFMCRMIVDIVRHWHNHDRVPQLGRLLNTVVPLSDRCNC